MAGGIFGEETIKVRWRSWVWMLLAGFRCGLVVSLGGQLVDDSRDATELKSLSDKHNEDDDKEGYDDECCGIKHVGKDHQVANQSGRILLRTLPSAKRVVISLVARACSAVRMTEPSGVVVTENPR